jgi:tRNA modification GTPase
MSKSYFNEDTIVAIATAANVYSAIGVIRVSGPQAFSAAKNVLQPHSKRDNFWQNVSSHQMYRASVISEGRVIDDGLFVFMRGPNSYTGEDQVEIQIHGNPLLLQRVCNAFIQTGMARLAEPGEFSFRAFRNGKIDLSQAEAVADLISAASPQASERALNVLLGNTKKFIDNMKDRLVRCLAEVEVDIDFSDQGVSVINYKEWAVHLNDWVREIESARLAFLQTQPLREGVRLALVGEPNAGKSTLFNAILQEDRSIVSEHAGTTRDVVREQFLLGGVLVRLSDTAGLRATNDSIEHQGIHRTWGEIKSAHIVALVLDASQLTNHAVFLEKVSQFETELEKQNPDAKKLILINKIDLFPNGLPFVISKNASYSIVCLSALKNQGRQDFEAALVRAFSLNNQEEGALLGRMRHFELLGRAVAAVEQAILKVEKDELFPDLLATDLREALSALGEITGEVNSDQVLQLIFSEFCIGK